jgi:outer membrane protein assembly factor BamA
MKFSATFALFVFLSSMFCFAEDTTPEQSLVIQDIQCKGNTKTDCSYISSYLYLSLGDAVNEEEIQNAKLRLSSIPNFSTVDIYLEKGTERGHAKVIIEVTEANPITKEVALGISREPYGWGLKQKIAGRISHQNLYGTGKILELEANGQFSNEKESYRNGTVAKVKFQALSSRLQYIDPSLFGSKKYYLIAGLKYDNYLSASDRLSYDMVEFYRIDLSIGRRFGDFSYITLGYSHIPLIKSQWKDTITGITQVNRSINFAHNLRVNYGWNNEDDAYFPTQGSRFNFGMGWRDRGNAFFMDNLAYQNTWRGDDTSIWTFKLGGTPNGNFRSTLDESQGLSLSYAKAIKSNSIFGDIEKGRWFIEPGMYGIGYSSSLGTVIDPGLKAGIRLQTKAFGIVDIYALGSTTLRVGGHNQ